MDLRMMASLSSAALVCACVVDPVVSHGGDKPTSDTDEPQIIVVPDEPEPTVKRVVPLEVIKQNPAFDASFPDAQFSYEPAATPDACAQSEFVAELLPIDLYVMLDRSGSMNIPQSLPPTTAGDCAVGDPTVSRWCYTLNALEGFFEVGQQEDTGVALQFFPNGTCSDTPPIGHNCCASGACCAGTADSVPAVALDSLSNNHGALVTALNDQSPNGVTTPIEAALRGITRWTQQNKSQLRSMAGLLITDGEPSGCSTNTELLANIVAQHLRDTGIPTFVLGMDGAKFAPLEAIAEAGGGASHTTYCPAGVMPCHVYNVGNGDPSAFADALAQIKGAVVQCRFGMPHPEAGVVDPRRMSVVYRAGGEEVTVSRVEAPDACTDGGFYFDDPVSPSEVTLCPQTCGDLRAASASELVLSVDCLGI